MRAQELRIGNYVDTPAGVKRVVSIVSSADGSIYDIRTAIRAIPGEENLFIDCELSPIPLTEELLLKCGFKKEKSGFRGGMVHYRMFSLFPGEAINYGPNNGELYPVINPSDYEFSKVPVKYLHQLQNLFFCLTGEELEVKLD